MTAPDPDRPNGDLTPGSFFLVTAWVGAKAYVRVTPVVASNGLHNVVAMSPEREPGMLPNRQLFGDLIEVVAVQYPIMVVYVHTSTGEEDYSKYRTILDMREIVAVKADPDLVKAFIPPEPEPEPVRWWQFWRRA